MRTARKFARFGTLIAFLTLTATAAVLTADCQEVIDATAMGTSTQMGKVISIKLLIYSYSTPGDKKVLDEAFRTGQNQERRRLVSSGATGHQ